MSDSLFTRLSTYAASHHVRPLENFATELLAWTVNHCPDFGLAFAQLFLQPDDAAPALSVRASTQRFLGRYGIADLWLDVEFGERRSTVLLVESKVEADIGERERADSVEGEIDVPDEEPELNTTGSQLPSFCGIPLPLLGRGSHQVSLSRSFGLGSLVGVDASDSLDGCRALARGRSSPDRRRTEFPEAAVSTVSSGARNDTGESWPRVGGRNEATPGSLADAA